MNEIMHILKLPTELLFEILMFCDPVAVVSFAEAFEEEKDDIWDLIENRRLWKYVLIPPDEKILKYVRRFGPKIKHLKICSFAENAVKKDESLINLEITEYGTYYEYGTLANTLLSLINSNNLAGRNKLKITKSFMLNVRFICTKLEKLTIANCLINSDKIKLKMFPKTISNLSFEDVYLPISNGHVFNSVYSSLFYRMQRSLPALKCLEVKGETRYLSDLVAAATEGLTYENYRNRRNFTWPHIKFGKNNYSIFKIENEVKGCLGEKEHRRLERYKIFKASIDLFKYITDNNFGHFLVDVKEVVNLGFH